MKGSSSGLIRSWADQRCSTARHRSDRRATPRACGRTSAPSLWPNLVPFAADDHVSASRPASAPSGSSGWSRRSRGTCQRGHWPRSRRRRMRPEGEAGRRRGRGRAAACASRGLPGQPRARRQTRGEARTEIRASPNGLGSPRRPGACRSAASATPRVNAAESKPICASSRRGGNLEGKIGLVGELDLEAGGLTPPQPRLRPSRRRSLPRRRCSSARSPESIRSRGRRRALRLGDAVEVELRVSRRGLAADAPGDLRVLRLVKGRDLGRRVPRHALRDRPRLDQYDRCAGFGQRQRRGRAHDPATDHRDVGLVAAAEGRPRLGRLFASQREVG